MAFNYLEYLRIVDSLMSCSFRPFEMHISRNFDKSKTRQSSSMLYKISAISSRTLPFIYDRSNLVAEMSPSPSPSKRSNIILVLDSNSVLETVRV